MLLTTSFERFAFHLLTIELRRPELHLIMRRKRKPPVQLRDRSNKRPRTGDCEPGPSKQINNPVLQYYYSELLTLRQYLSSQLPSSSRRRRQLLKSIGRASNNNDNKHDAEVQSCIAGILDSNLVGIKSQTTEREEVIGGERSSDFQQFSQQLVETSGGALPSSRLVSQREVRLRMSISTCYTIAARNKAL